VEVAAVLLPIRGARCADEYTQQPGRQTWSRSS